MPQTKTIRQKKLTHPKEEKFGKRINFWLPSEHYETLSKIYVRHRMPTTDLLRGLIAIACEYYEKHGYFTLPATITPEQVKRGE